MEIKIGGKDFVYIVIFYRQVVGMLHMNAISNAFMSKRKAIEFRDAKRKEGYDVFVHRIEII